MIENINLNGSTVSAELHGFMYDGVYNQNGIFDYDNCCNATIESNNTIKISSGLIINQGRFMRIKGTESISIASGTSGTNRTDLIVAQFNTDGINETHELVVKKGTSEAMPSYVDSDIYNGGLKSEVPLYRVHLTGTTIDSVDRVLPLIYSNKSLIQEKIDNSNLLINPDFKINQRALNEYDYSSVTTKENYTVDRWKCTALKVTPITSGVKCILLEAPSYDGKFIQQIEEYIYKYCTMSFDVLEISGTVQCILTNNSKQTSSITLTQSGIYSLGLTQANNVQFYLTKGSKLKLAWTKLEVGRLRTPFVTPNFALEMHKCRRYFFKSNIDTKIVEYYGYNIYVFLDLAYMRGSSTITLKNSSGVQAINLNKLGNITSINQIYSGNDRGGHHIQINTSKNNTNDIFITAVLGTHFVEIDAEIY